MPIGGTEFLASTYIVASFLLLVLPKTIQNAIPLKIQNIKDTLLYFVVQGVKVSLKIGRGVTQPQLRVGDADSLGIVLVLRALL